MLPSKGDLVLVLNNNVPLFLPKTGYAKYKIPDKWVGSVLIVADGGWRNDLDRDCPPLILRHPHDEAYPDNSDLCWAWLDNVEVVSTR